MTDDRQLPTEPDHGPDTEREPVSSPAEPAPGRRHAPPLPPPTRREPSSADVRPRRPDYRGEELDPERGPGLGCFWFQVLVLGFFIVIIPVGLNLNWPFELLALLLFVVIGLLLLTGQTVIFLLRLVAADRRATGRRRPIASPTKTVGEIEDELRPAAETPADTPSEATAEAAAASGADEPADREAAPSEPEPPSGVEGAPEAATEVESVPAPEPEQLELMPGAPEPEAEPGAGADPGAEPEPGAEPAPVEPEPAPPEQGDPDEPEEPDPGVRQ